KFNAAARRSRLDGHRVQQPFVLMADPPRDGFFYIGPGAFLGAATNGLLPGWDRPVNAPGAAHSPHLNHTPPQENTSVDPPDRPCLGRISGLVRMMNSNPEKLRHCGASRALALVKE